MSGMKNYIQLMKNIRFLSLWSGSLISEIGDAVVSVSLIWIVYQQTQNPFILALTLICINVPKFIFSPLYGVFIDRYPAIFFAIASNILSALLFLFIVFIPFNSTVNYAVFMLLIALSSSLAPITKTASYIILTETVEKDHLVSANSLMNIQLDLALSLGPIIGGIVIAYSNNIEFACLFNALTFIIAAILYYIAMPPHSRNRKKVVERNASLKLRYINWKHELFEGFKVIFNSKIIRNAVLANLFWNLFIWGTSATLIPLFAKQHLGSGASGYGILTSVLSVGIVIGSFITGTLKVNKSSLSSLVFLSMIIHGLAYSLMFLPNNIVQAVIVLMITGIVSAPAMIYNRTILQTTVPKEMMGRVFTASSALGTFGYPIGTTIAASSVSILGQQNTSLIFLFFGLATAISIMTLWITTKEHKEKELSIS